jgi:hypothetical protein
MRTMFVLLVLGAASAYAQLGTDVVVGGMSTSRDGATATLLTNGTVLVAGGSHGGLPGSTAEIYDPAIRQFRLTGPLTAARRYHTATLLRNGKVLLAGGVSLSTQAPSGRAPTATAELYDPASGRFTATYGQMPYTMARHTATLLNDGTVLIAGGNNGDSISTGFRNASVYDPNSDTFLPTGSLKVARAAHTATLLSNGRVLLTGGASGSVETSTTAELYDPASRQFIATGSMAHGRIEHFAARIASGKVMVGGGDPSSFGVRANGSVEVYDPAAQTFSPLPNLNVGRIQATATELANGNVFIAGGDNATWDGVYADPGRTVELYDVAQNRFVLGILLIIGGRYGHTATLLADGSILLAGADGGSADATAELFTLPNATGMNLNRIVPAVASAQGAFGSSFSTALLICNPTTAVVTGQLLYRSQASPDVAAMLPFTIPANGTVSYTDVLTSMGASGVGTLDVLAAGSSPLNVIAHVRNIAANGGTSGFIESGFRASDALQAGQTAVLFGPSDTSRFRTNIGVRTLDSLAMLRFDVRSASGDVIASVTRTYNPQRFEQASFEQLTGIQPVAGMTVIVNVMSGSAFAYASVTDNLTNDPAAQFAQLLN